jgi:hypothetical protein
LFYQTERPVDNGQQIFGHAMTGLLSMLAFEFVLGLSKYLLYQLAKDDLSLAK